MPSCEDGFEEVSACLADDVECHTVTVCGSTIACQRERSCEGPRPLCNAGDVEVAECPQDVACYSRSTCGFTIWCVTP